MLFHFFLVKQENELERLHFNEECHQATYLGCAIRISYFYLLPTGTYDQGKKYFVLLMKGAAMEFFIFQPDYIKSLDMWTVCGVGYFIAKFFYLKYINIS